MIITYIVLFVLFAFLVSVAYLIGSMLVEEYNIENDKEASEYFPPDWSDDLRGMS
jgi:uncharacterized membrane protein